MNRDQYLGDMTVAGFTQWLAQELRKNSLPHCYRMPKRRIEFSGLADALSQYSWPFSFSNPDTGEKLEGCTYNDSANALDVLRSGLEGSLAGTDNEPLRQWCGAVVKWGGVSNGNLRWLKLRADENQLVDGIRQTRCLLAKGDESPQNLSGIDRFNAGMTKIYSLLVPNFVIYDSRVAAALAWLVVQWCLSSRQREVPSLLRFRCMPAKEGANAAIRKIRNPSTSSYEFPAVNGNSQHHAQWNLRASWILTRTVELAADTAFHRQPDPLRALEAALFMWGYDLRESCGPPWSREARNDS